jgi:hypothetical protein
VLVVVYCLERNLGPHSEPGVVAIRANVSAHPTIPTKAQREVSKTLPSLSHTVQQKAQSQASELYKNS